MKDTSQKLEDCFLLTHTDAQSKPMINFRTYGVYCLHNLFSFSSIFNYFPLFFFTSIQFFCLSQSLPLRRGEMSSLSSGRRLSITRLDRIYREKKQQQLTESPPRDPGLVREPDSTSHFQINSFLHRSQLGLYTHMLFGVLDEVQFQESSNAISVVTA